MTRISFEVIAGTRLEKRSIRTAAARCFGLEAAFHAAAGHEADGAIYLGPAILAVLQGQLGRAATGARSWLFRRRLAGLRYQLLVRLGEFERALAPAHEHEQLGRNAGLEVAPAATAFLLAKLGPASEAAAAVEDSLDRFPRIHPAQRPHHDLARALWELGRQTEAASQARDAYRQAWHDGPPNSHHWALRDARELLHAMGEPIPDLPFRDPATVQVPLEDKIRARITQLEASGTSGT
jgi:hypothetical protein